ncbi:hypothetical protein CIG75_08045 [Tumebacillus algifaecis]|uniref:SPOR domain-containing protein n=1 Tax=Tumebacillus algifaecis TaxID=1214604 RepID=A0A223CZZ6_9BACL|nr:SPOR domain-containing protein [Tumebacillus algifaecis]ASS74938.1 hypothetical protein CIG75_08045 [Tumebacillus algifaecis]
MDQSQVTINIKSKTASTPTSSTRYPSRLRRGLKNRKGKDKDKGQIVFPLLLATLTGILLGVCLLLLFKGQTTAGDVSATSTDATNTTRNGQMTDVSGEADLPGVSLYAMQIGVFKDRARAEALQKAVSEQGVGTVIRGTDQFQVFTAVVTDKAAGAKIEAKLKELGIQHYPKEFIIPARSGKMEGLTEADAKKMADGLDHALQLAAAVMPLAIEEAPDAAKASALQSELTKFDEDLKTWQSMLTKANRSEEKALVEKMHSSLAEAVRAAQGQKGMFAIQVKLTAFYLGYESLLTNLLKSE